MDSSSDNRVRPEGYWFQSC